jgi:hypothetical protein
MPLGTATVSLLGTGFAPENRTVPHSSRFELPPLTKNEHGQLRTVGFELEFGNITGLQGAAIIKKAFGGKVVESGPAEFHVLRTTLGDFSVKLDTRIGRHPPSPDGLLDIAEAELSNLARTAMSSIVPQEIVTPPIPLDRIEELASLERMLRSAGASGTEEGLLYAFALHINPEAPSLRAHAITSMIKAFALLSPWLWESIQPDMTRRLLGFAEPFQETYVTKILQGNYWPDIPELMDDYLDANPTRDRDLDLLPLFSYLDEAFVRARLPNEKVGRRPTFHYRLPDARVSDPTWSLAIEWNRWVTVERLAADRPRLLSASEAYLRNGTDRNARARIVPGLARA